MKACPPTSPSVVAVSSGAVRLYQSTVLLTTSAPLLPRLLKPASQIPAHQITSITFHAHTYVTMWRNRPSSSISTDFTTARTKLVSCLPNSSSSMSWTVDLLPTTAFERERSRQGGRRKHRRHLSSQPSGLLESGWWCRARIMTNQPRLRHDSLVRCSLDLPTLSPIHAWYARLSQIRWWSLTGTTMERERREGAHGNS